MKRLHQIIAICLACTLVLSTTSFSIVKHYCGNHLVDTSWFGKAKHCAMEMAMTQAASCENTVQKSSCCSDKHTFVKGQDELKFHKDQITFKKIVLSNKTIFGHNLQSIQETEQNHIPFDGYPPPLITYNLTVLYETYLI